MTAKVDLVEQLINEALIALLPDQLCETRPSPNSVRRARSILVQARETIQARTAHLAKQST